MSKFLLLLLIIYLLSVPVIECQNINRQVQNDHAMSQNRKILHIPDIPGYVTLKCDFHVHTVFSDGSVWPDFRVTEAWTEGLDVLALTDHIEGRPHARYTGNDQNSAFEAAQSKAKSLNILLVQGAEISKQVPPGHLNALFISDVNKMINDDPMVQVEEAVKQGGFILWNHPGWGWARPLPDTTKWWDFQTEILKKGWLHGIEVYNTEEWYPVAVGWAKEKGLTVFANSDIHAPINYWYDLSPHYSHRPMTLVFSEDRSVEGVKEALFAKRTLAYFDDIVAGDGELIKKLFLQSVMLHKPFASSGKPGSRSFSAEFENRSDITFILKKEGKFRRNDRSDFVKLLPESITIIQYRENEPELSYSITNCYSDADEHPLIQLPAVRE
jgi:predicted metal-dependent phosphoesterase TrpH